ncbi:MAG: adenylosuccinate lyase [Anaerolineae bacterium UTCFX2]|jgi:adenylosuccinate lyase|nr:adenylosuccinate lyase [Anaerolineae bacterium]MCZ7551847.1 adenylosuccinate lyase [Anaerolineales bacterium]OQY87485.1 MAG: adenylosuccinate lyase [Anaerolineae bacterium UTCFX2]
MTFDYRTYLSPFTWRYGSAEMRFLWSEAYKRSLWRKIWVALAQAEADFNLVTPEQVQSLHAHIQDIDVERALEIEAEIHHDLMAELKAFAEQAPDAGRILHLGATSADIEDNADVLRTRAALDLTLERLSGLLLDCCAQIERLANTPIMAFTHLQPAEPSTLGYRLAVYAQDLYLDWQRLTELRSRLRAKGMRGAVGTGASYAELLGADQLPAFERRVSDLLGLSFFTVVTQVYPRKQDYQVVSGLAGLGASLYKFAFDLRFLQSPPVGELSEPFGKLQVGSSAMPFKRNPINSEKIDSLARQLALLPRLAWDNAAHSLLERTLDDSANRRTLLPEAFLIADELLLTARRIFTGLVIDEAAIQRNLEAYGPFAGIERALMRLVMAGADRQEMHESLRGHALTAWERLRKGEANPLIEIIAADEQLLKYLPAVELRRLMDIARYVGDAPQRALQLAQEIQTTIVASRPGPTETNLTGTPTSSSTLRT